MFNIPDAFIDRTHRASRTDDTVIVHFTTFRHCTMFYSERKELKNGVKVPLNKIQIRPTDQKMKKYLKSIPNVGFICADMICRLKIHFSNNNESFFDSMGNAVSKAERFPDDISFLFSYSTVIFRLCEIQLSIFCFEMISLSEVCLWICEK